MIVVTGAAGFIGSCLVARLNAEGFNDLVLVDDFSDTVKSANLEGKKFREKVERDIFIAWLADNHRFVQFVFHIGARTDTTEQNVELFNRLNLDYTKAVWNRCVEFGLPLVYASSAATYGSGEHGYSDAHELIPKLKPLNPYGDSKNDFDKWALSQDKKPYFWVGLKFFNVYGPNEYHKGRMASVVLHAFNQIRENGHMKLFRSHNPDYKDGEQLRDFVYVKDVASICCFFLHHRKDSGIYNLGSGKARTFLGLVKNTFAALKKEASIDFIDTPADIREKYQYFTEADMSKLLAVGYSQPFYTLEQGVAEYVSDYLVPHRYY
jgi:ADP-L-glycero-D-manno-heptose 6-epimerase